MPKSAKLFKNRKTLKQRGTTSMSHKDVHQATYAFKDVAKALGPGQYKAKKGKACK